jgi:hypothetical protein
MLLASWVLVAVTAVLVIVTIRLGNKQLGVAIELAKQQNEALRAELKARLQLQFIDRFDSDRTVEARKELALTICEMRHAVGCEKPYSTFSRTWRSSGCEVIWMNS